MIVRSDQWTGSKGSLKWRAKDALLLPRGNITQDLADIAQKMHRYPDSRDGNQPQSRDQPNCSPYKNAALRAWALK
jgi:hypothetical protein